MCGGHNVITFNEFRDRDVLENNLQCLYAQHIYKHSHRLKTSLNRLASRMHSAEFY